MQTPNDSPTPERRYDRAIVVALLFCVAFLASIEAVTRLGFQRVSRIEGRIHREYQDARQTASQPTAQKHPPVVLMLGNSLLLEAMDYDAIRKLTESDARIVRFVIEQTNYLDWYYGVRRLLAEGLRPDFIVLCLAPSHMLSSATRGDYSSYYLFQVKDIPLVAKDAGYDLTRESSLIAAHYSLFYSGRAGLRGFLLNRIDPSYATVLHDLTTRPAEFPSSEEMERTMERRLRQLNESIAGRSRLVFVLPPGFSPGEKEASLAAAKAGVPMLVPVHTGELPKSMFQDAFHVNEAGAQRFTEALAVQLKALVGQAAR